MENKDEENAVLKTVLIQESSGSPKSETRALKEVQAYTVKASIRIIEQLHSNGAGGKAFASNCEVAGSSLTART